MGIANPGSQEPSDELRRCCRPQRLTALGYAAEVMATPEVFGRSKSSEVYRTDAASCRPGLCRLIHPNHVFYALNISIEVLVTYPGDPP